MEITCLSKRQVTVTLRQCYNFPLSNVTAVYNMCCVAFIEWEILTYIYVDVII